MTTDETALPELTKRQEAILSLIVRAHTENAEPISSRFLMEHSGLGVSSATIRNEMAVLEEKGYVNAPHTSAGRVPTENGYRYFVKRLLNNGELSSGEQTQITEKIKASPLGTETWLRAAAATLARVARTASIVTPPLAETSRFKHMELISIQGRLVLLVLVLHGGSVHQRMLNLGEAIPQERLSDIATRLNNLCLDLTMNDVRMKAIGLPLLERDICETVAELMERADGNAVRIVYRDGLSEVISAFHNNEGAQQVVRVFEERAFLNMIIAEFLNPLVNQVEVIVAGDGRRDELNRISIVLSRYGLQGQVSGTVGVLGPTNLNYARAVSAVRHMSTLMSDMVASLYAPGSEDLALPGSPPDESD